MSFFKWLLKGGIFRRKVTKEKLDNEVSKYIKRFGKTKEIRKFEKFRKDSDLKDKFFEKLFRISSAKAEERKKLVREAKKIADKIPEFRGWPDKPSKFWDVEAFSWKAKIPSNVRLFIRKEMLKRSKLGALNLSLGSGSYPYLENSILVDLSPEMLKLAEPAAKFNKKLIYNLGQGNLPFKDNTFDVVSMVFVVNYLNNIPHIFNEIKRVLKEKGKLIIIQSGKSLDDWYLTQEKKKWKPEQLKETLKQTGFRVKVENKRTGRTKLIFIEAVNL